MKTAWLLLIAIPAAGALAPASAQEKPAFDVLSYYPPAALAAGVGGHAWLSCTWRQSLPKDCQVLQESPAGQGFGAAALKIAADSKPDPRAKLSEGQTYQASVGFAAKPPVIWPNTIQPLRVITMPNWLVMPTPQELAAFFPRGARAQTARVTLTCTVSLDTTVRDCRVKEETPAGQGFGEAALKASKLFRISPRTVDGEPEDGGVVEAALDFSR